MAISGVFTAHSHKTSDKNPLLDLNPVASMHFASHPSNDRRGRAHLNVNHHNLTDDLARHEGTMSFHFAGCYRSITIAAVGVHDCCFVFRAVRLVAETTATKTVALKTSRTVARQLFVVDARDVAGAKRTIDREIVPSLDLIF